MKASFQEYWDDWRLLVRASKPQKTIIIVAFVATLIAAVLEGVGVALVIPFVESLQETSSTAFKTGIEFVDRVFLAVGEDSLTRLYRISMSIAVVAFVRAIFGLIAGYYGGKAQEYASHELRRMVNDQSNDVALSFYSHARAGEIISISTNEAQRVRFLLDTLQTVAMRLFFLVMYAVAMFVISWQLSIFGISVFLLMTAGISSLTRWISRSARIVPQMLGTMTSITTETIAGMRLIRAWSMQETEKRRYADYSRATADRMVETHKRRIVVPTINKLISTMLLLVIVVGAIQLYVIPGRMEAGMLAAFLFAMLRISPIVVELNNARGTIATIIPALTAIRRYLDPTDKPYLQDGTKEMDSFQDRIEFKNVSFEYEEGNPVLHDVNLLVEQGMTVALVGGSGAGKSTLVDLLPRFIDVTNGSIEVDGVDIREFSQKSLRSHIGVVSQEAFVFNASVRDNIAYGLPNATDDEVLEAARRANAADFINGFPDGLNTMLGDRGAAMSGGQRQRIEIARCFMRNPEILILDEATSALDSLSEKLVQESLNVLMEGRTVFAIAHRLSTIRGADLVVVLENGQIVETGTYEELLAKKGALFKYHSIQVDMELSSIQD
ncbi:MAG: ABC transporter ATP-binding protein [Rhodothermales bacterium]|nr:ABC transporter ATP-binding protein [Rhodothermales bacterium]